MNNKREIIIKAAHRLIIQEGSSNFSMRKLASITDMSLGNLQYYYKTKADLIHGILESYLSIYQSELDLFLKSTTKGRDGIEDLIYMVLNDSENDNDNFFIVLFSFSDDKSMTSSIEYYYKTLSTLINKAVEHISNIECNDEVLNNISSLLLPYFDGFDSVNSFITIDKKVVTNVLTETIWSLLTK